MNCNLMSSSSSSLPINFLLTKDDFFSSDDEDNIDVDGVDDNSLDILDDISSDASQNSEEELIKIFEKKIKLNNLNDPKSMKDIAEGPYTNKRVAQKSINTDIAFYTLSIFMIHIFEKSRENKPPDMTLTLDEKITGVYGENKQIKKKQINK